MDLVSSKAVYKRGNITLTEKIFRQKNQEVTRVSLSLGKQAVLIVPIDQGNNFYLAQQKRGDSKTFILEFPSGGIEKNENEINAAKRELSEELGLEGEMIYIGKFRPFYSLVDLQVSVFLCKNAKVQKNHEKQKADFYEKIQRKKISQRELYKLIKQGKMTESYSLSALSLFNSYIS